LINSISDLIPSKLPDEALQEMSISAQRLQVELAHDIYGGLSNIPIVGIGFGAIDSFIYANQGTVYPQLNDVGIKNEQNYNSLLTGALSSLPLPGAKAASQAEKLALNTARENLLNKAENSTLKNIINELYRPNAKVGNGSAMDALRYEQTTGSLLSKIGHSNKLYERYTQLQKLLFNKQINASDKQIIKELINDIQKALSGR
jgi:ribosomal protein S20